MILKEAVHKCNFNFTQSTQRKMQERKDEVIKLYVFANLAEILAPFARDFILDSLFT